MTQQISFMDPEVQKCPFAAYDEVRSQGPVYVDPQTGWYFVTDYDLVRALTADHENLSSFTGVLMCKTDSPNQAELDQIWEQEGFLPTPVLVVGDPPDHSFHRSFVDKAFMPARVKQMEDYLENIVEEIIEQFIDRGEMDFKSDLAVKLPLLVIADQLGMPRSDIDKLYRWSEAVMAHQDQSLSHERQVELTKIICELHQYTAAKVEEYREKPRESLLSDFANTEVDGRKLTMREIAAMMEQVLTGGHESTTNAMTSGMLRLIELPELQAQLRDDPKLIPKFVEEVLRLDAPVQGLFREARRDIEIGGVPVPAGSVVVLKWGAANRDASQFPEPDKLDLNRPNARRHMSFGFGPHQCVGNLLARGEMRIAYSKVLKRMQRIRLAIDHDELVREPHFFFYGVKALPITFDPI